MEDIKNEGKEKRIYELALLLKTEADFTRIAETVKQHAGDLVAEPRMRNVALAYKIEGHTEAVFVSCPFHAFGEDAKALEEDLRTRKQAIRFMIVTAAAPQGETRPTVVPAFPEEGGRKAAHAAPRRESRPAAPAPLSNEALENLLKKI